MAIIVNKNTTQTPLTSGLTGTQVIKFIDAPRFYIKAKDSTPTPPVAKSNGSTPAGWTDLGVVEGKARVAYDKELNEIRTGIDNILRVSYVRQRTGTLECVLTQFDDVVIQELSGVTPSVITSGSIVQFAIGGEDVIEKAILLVLQNKIDGKELQFYHPAGNVSFTIEESGDATVVRARVNLPAFVYDSLDRVMLLSDFA